MCRDKKQLGVTCNVDRTNVGLNLLLIGKRKFQYFCLEVLFNCASILG